MRGAALVLAALTAVAVPLAVAPSSTAACGSLVAQDDAGSGVDAGDAATAALPLADVGDFLAHLGGVDLADWFEVELGGDGETVMIEAYRLAYDDAAYLLGPLAVEAWPPGADEPYRGALTDDGATNVTVEANGVPGTWRFRVASTTLDGAPCASPVAATAASPSYALYFGCKPYCLALAE